MINLCADDLIAAPFPHAVKDGILPVEVFQALQREFPGDDLFDENQRQEWGGGRINLVRGNPIFERFIQKSPAWGEFFHYVNSQRFVSRMVDLFGPFFAPMGSDCSHTDSRFADYVKPLEYALGGRSTAQQWIAKRLRLRGVYDRAMRLLDSKRLYVNFDIARSRGGYHVGPHTDSSYKLVVGLIYFNNVEELGGQGGELLLHRHKQDLPMSQYVRHPEESDVEIVKRVKPHANLGVFQLNCNNSYHSTTPLHLEKGYRRFLYVSVAQPYVNSAWL